MYLYEGKALCNQFFSGTQQTEKYAIMNLDI